MTERPYTVKLVRTLLFIASAGIVIASIMFLFLSVAKLVAVLYLGVFALTAIAFLEKGKK